MKVAIVTFQDKYGSENFLCYTNTEFVLTLFEKMKERLSYGFYMGSDGTEVERLIELDKNDPEWAGSVIDFMYKRSDHEYEGFDTQIMITKITDDKSLDQFIPKRYRLLS